MTIKKETIYALATARGRGGVAVIRVSGDQAKTCLAQLCGLDTPKPRFAYFKQVVSRETKIDDALVIYFEGPHSFTGEDVVEFHLHGGKAITQIMLDTLAEFEGYRLAEPGEFTRRAFENDKMDLTQAEAIADLVDAETEYQRQQALLQAGGALSKKLEDWRARLVRILAYAEAHLDFPDEEDVPDHLNEEALHQLKELKVDIQAYLNDNRRGERLRDGISVAIIGAPNAGKSSFLNLVAQRDAAIISDVAGTTRDVLEVPIDLGGYPVLLVDTAGLRPDQLDGSEQSKIEEEGIKRALKAAEEADIRLLVFNAEQLPVIDENTAALKTDTAIQVMNKCDVSRETIPEEYLPLSVKTKEGLDEVLQTITQQVEDLYGFTQTPSITRERHRSALLEALEGINAAQEHKILELSTEELRRAATAIGKITGKIDVEQLLDVIFRDFCIGK